MNFRTKQAIIKLNKDFYTKNSKDFDKNRKGRSWVGVRKCLDFVNIPNQKILVLDIACGNGRFVFPLSSVFNPININYVGVDTNKLLLKSAKNLCEGIGIKSYKLINKSVFSKNLILPKADLVVAFGITHHIPSDKYRINWLSNLTNFVQKDGYLVLSFWDTQKDNAVCEIPRLSIYKKNLQDGDMFFSWGDSNVYRYYHKYSKKELLLICNKICDQGFKLVKSFNVKEFNKNTNKYYIFKNKMC